MKTKQIITMALAAASLFLTGGCMKEKSLRHEKGPPIRFGASTQWPNAPATKTSYSGYDEGNSLVGKGSEYERIDWEPGYDQVRILCAQALGETAGSYLIGDRTASGKNSVATTVTPVGDSEILRWGEAEEHVFYAMYPVAGMESNYAEFGTVASADAVFAPSGSGAVLGGRIPSDQPAHRDGTYRFKPDMNFAYMYAQEKVNPEATSGAVTLHFRPLVTAIEFTLISPTTDYLASPLKKVRLLSGANPLSGSFSAALSEGHVPVVTVGAGTDDKLTIDLGEGVTLGTDAEHAVKFTFLALPVSQTRLTLQLLFADNTTRALELKIDSDGDGQKDDWIEVAAAKKFYVSNIAVPKGEGFTYYIDNLSCPVVDGVGQIYIDAPLNDDGTSVDPASAKVQFDSYKISSLTGEKIPVQIGRVEYSADGETGWSETLPSVFFQSDFDPDQMGETIRQDATASATGFTPGEKVTEVYDAAQRHTGILRSRAVVGSADAPRDLSLYTVEGYLRNGGKRVTANCYVVNAPGWFKFPLVYGNAIDQVKVTEGEGINVNAYDAPDEVNPESLFLKVFQNYQGVGITSPYILTDTGVSLSDVEAVVIWSDAGVTASEPSGYEVEQLSSMDVSVLPDEHGFIRLYVSPSKIHQGNALVALRKKASADPDKTILWSWHIWISDLSMETVRVQSENPKVSEVPARANTDFMEYNLGACEEGKMETSSYTRAPYYVRVTQQDADGYWKQQVFKVMERGDVTLHAEMSSGTYYQFGRKDPFLPSNGEVETAIVRIDNPVSSTVNKHYYHHPDYQIVHDATTPTTGIPYDMSEKALNYQTPTAGNAGESIRNPHVFYYYPESQNWMREATFYNVWDANKPYGYRDRVPVKTVYDPCPPGFVVPNYRAFLNFNGKGESEATVELTDQGAVYDGFNCFNVIDLNGDGIISEKDFERGFYFRRNGANVNAEEGVLSGRGNGVLLPATGYRLPGPYTTDTILESDVYEMGLEGWYWTTASYYGSGITFTFSTHLIHAGTHGQLNQGFYMSYYSLKSALGAAVRAMKDE